MNNEQFLMNIEQFLENFGLLQNLDSNKNWSSFSIYSSSLISFHLLRLSGMFMCQAILRSWDLKIYQLTISPWGSASFGHVLLVRPPLNEKKK